MADPTTDPIRRPPALARRVALARLALFCEDLLVRLWRAVALFALLAGLTLLGTWALLPGILHVALLAVFAGAIAWTLWRDLRGLAWPGDAAGLRRLELKSGFSHRPLLALADRYAGSQADGASRALFEAHRRRMIERLRAVRIGRPLSRVAEFDRYALRTVAVLVLTAGLIAGWSEARANLIAVFHPDFSRGLGAPDPLGQATLWITPPAYTGVPPVWLDPLTAASVDRPIMVPAASELVVQVRGGTEAPLVMIDDTANPFEAAGPGSYQITLALNAGSRLAIVQSDQEIASWPIDVVPDAAPTIVLTDQPKETLRTGLRLDVDAHDDYGIDGIVARFTLVEQPDTPPLELLVPIAHAGVTESTGPVFYNLMTHPWAGMRVSMQLTVTDGVGQTGRTEPVEFELPERFFFNQAARQVAEARKTLVADPASAADVAGVLDAVSQKPEDFLDDPAVYLALYIAVQQLVFTDPEETRDGVIDLMWDTAVAIEEGPLAFAEQRVHEIQDRLVQALAEGASEQEVERLIDELRAAMEDYMHALSNRLRTDSGELYDPTDALKAVGSRELTDLVDQIRDLVRTGALDQAQSLLTRLKEIMENISVGNLQDLTGSLSAEAAEVLQTIRQLMSGQQDLLDQTFRMLRDDTDGTYDSQMQYQSQSQLSDTLQGMMDRMDEFGFSTSREFERADRSMTRSARQLEANRPGQAIDHETAAIDQLRAGADALMQELMQQAGEDGQDQGANYFAAPRDPMGRNLGGAGDADASDINLPERGALMKAREILDELYRRAGERDRPADEQQYLQRLLRRF